jgi:K+-transporting ATPase A subunit
LLTPLVVLPLASWALVTDAGRAGLTANGGSRDFTEILFAYASCMANKSHCGSPMNSRTLSNKVWEPETRNASAETEDPSRGDELDTSRASGL